jgi:WD40 repeat protein
MRFKGLASLTGAACGRHLDVVRAVAFAERDPTLVSASDDGTVKMWNLAPVLARQRCVVVRVVWRGSGRG